MAAEHHEVLTAWSILALKPIADSSFIRARQLTDLGDPSSVVVEFADPPALDAAHL